MANIIILQTFSTASTQVEKESFISIRSFLLCADYQRLSFLPLRCVNLYLRRMALKQLIPNGLTLLNASLGGLAIILLLRFQDVETACLCILGAAIADFFDGFAARMLNVAGPLGKQLDSLADAISFGVFPALLGVFTLENLGVDSWVMYTPLIILPASVYRLANFNIDTRQTHGFIGIPTPAVTLLWVGIAMTIYSLDFQFNWLPIGIVVAAIASAYLLNANIPMLSMKIVGGKISRSQAILIAISLATFAIVYLLARNPWAPVPFILLLYPIISVITRTKHA